MTQPRPYQQAGIRRIERFAGRALLADEMGLGKSLQCLFWVRDFLDKGPTVIVCPAHLKWNWQREAARHIQRNAVVLESRNPPPSKGRYSSDTIFVINYEILPFWLKWLRQHNPKCVIPDEVHHIKNRSTKSYKAVAGLCVGVPHLIAVSGTPLTNRPAELFPILNLLRPDKFDSFWSYATKYCPPKKKPWGWEFNGATNLPGLHKRLKRTCMIRRLKSDVLRDLPRKRRYIVPVPIDNQSEYTQASKDIIKWLMKTKPQKAKKARSAERLVQMTYLKQLAAMLKIKSVIKWVDNFLEESNEKVILFGIHRDVLGPIYKHFQKKAVIVDGSLAGRKRQLAFDKFNHNQGCRLLVGNIQAAGTGWSAKASTVAFAELDWRPAMHTQAEDRIYGLERGVEGTAASIYYLYARNTIEDKLVRLLQSKQDVLDSILDGFETEDGLNLFDLLEDSLLKGNDQ